MAGIGSMLIDEQVCWEESQPWLAKEVVAATMLTIIGANSTSSESGFATYLL